VLQVTYFKLVESMPGKYRKAFVFNINYSVWMNTFCHTVCCMLHICAVEETICDSRLSPNINNVIHATICL